MASPPRNCGRGPKRPMMLGVDVEASAPSERRYEGAASDGVLFERDAALAVLTSSLDGLETGRGGVVALEAVYGNGKTAVLDTVAELARERGLQVLTARGRELERDLELGVALQLFEARLGAADAAERELLLQGPARAALPLFEAGPSARETEAAGVPGARPLPAHGEHRRGQAARPGHRRRGHGRRRHPALPSLSGGQDRAAADRADAGVRVGGGQRGRGHAGGGGVPSRHASADAPAAERRGHGRLAAGVVLPGRPRRFCAAVHEASGGSPWLVGELCRELAARRGDPDDGAPWLRCARRRPSRSRPRSCAAPAPSNPRPRSCSRRRRCSGPARSCATPRA